MCSSSPIHPCLLHFPLAEWLPLLLNWFYLYFVHNYFQRPSSGDNTGQKRQICFKEHFPFTIMVFFFLMESGGHSWQSEKDGRQTSRQPFHCQSQGRIRRYSRNYKDCSSSQGSYNVTTSEYLTFSFEALWTANHWSADSKSAVSFRLLLFFPIVHLSEIFFFFARVCIYSSHSLFSFSLCTYALFFFPLSFQCHWVTQDALWTSVSSFLPQSKAVAL